MAYKTKKFYHTYQRLCDWYGSETANQEILAYCPETTEISAMASKILSTLVSKEVLQLMKLKEHWDKIAGPQIAAVAEPRNIDKDKIYIKVNHSIWLRELNGSTKKQLLKNTHQILGSDFCKDMIFVP